MITNQKFKTRIHNTFLVLSLFLLTINFAVAKNKEQTTENKTHILFIGNSYTFWVEDMLNDALEKSAFKDRAKFSFHTRGSTNLGYFAQDNKLISSLTSQNYDLVVLQEWSRGVGNTTKTTQYFHNALSRFQTIASNHFDLMLYMTWGRDNAEGYKDYKDMHNRVSQGYNTASKKYDTKLAPIGLVWDKVFDELEKTGRGKELYDDSIGHPSIKGQMIIASVFFKVFFNDNLSWYKPSSTAGFTENEWRFVTRAVNEIKEIKPVLLPEQVKTH